MVIDWLLSSFCILYLASKFPVIAYNPPARWGQAAALVNNALYVHGGKMDPFNSYGYTSAPTSNDLLLLSLSSSFSTAAPPWQLLINSSDFASSQGPVLSWHTLCAFNASQLLLFGGLPGPNSPPPLVNSADSAYILDVSNQLMPLWMVKSVSWANEPPRRIHHSSAAGPTGTVFVVGGEKPDGSDNPLNTHYLFQSSTPSFTVLPTDNGPSSITGHASVMIPDGRLLVFGGYAPSQASLLPMSTIWSLDTNQNPSSWSLLQVSNSSLPLPRRSFAATSLVNGNVLIHGGYDGTEHNFADGWILDTSQTPMAWLAVETLSQLGSRREHSAVTVGNQTLFAFGYGDNSPAPPSLQIYDYAKNAFMSSFTPSLSIIHSSTPGTPRPTQTPGSSGTGTLLPYPSDTGFPTDGHAKQNKKTIVAIVTALALLSLIAVAVGATYYLKHRRSRLTGDGRFMVLGNDGDGRNSPHFEGGPIAIPYHDGRNYGNLWNSSILNSLSGLVGGTAVSSRSRNPPERRDMLADEDTWEFGAWYAQSRSNGMTGSSWSLRSIFRPRLGSREPSAVNDSLKGSRREKTDSSARTSLLNRDDEFPSSLAVQIASNRSSLVNYSHAKNYTDPFADPITEEWNAKSLEEPAPTQKRPYLHPLPQPVTTIRAVPSSLQGDRPPHILSERPSQNTLSVHDSPSSYSSQIFTKQSRLNGSGSHLTSIGSLDPLRPSAFSTSSIFEERPFTQLVRSNDSWWTRFSRTSFLDRKLSSGSRASGGLSEFRDPNPPPRLIPIDEGISNQHPSDLTLGVSISKSLSSRFGTHNKSKTSVGTADTEVIERMARATDVQVVRSGSQRTISSANRTSLHIHTQTNSSSFWSQEGSSTDATPVERSDEIELKIPSKDILDNTPRLSQPASHQSPFSVGMTDVPSTTSSPCVTARVHEFERRMTHDQALSYPVDTTRKDQSTKRPGGSGMSGNYGLTLRPSLFIANPDHRKPSSSDS